MIIIYKRPGRLANSIWLYAHFIAYAIENNIPVCFPALMDYGSYFKFSESNLLYCFPKQNTVISSHYLRSLLLRFVPYLIRLGEKFKLSSILYIFLKEGVEFDLEEISNFKILNKKFVFVEGWLFRSKTSIIKHRKKIIDFFEPKEKYKDHINTLINKCRRECTILIGIHIRREDYKTAFDGKYYYEMSDYKRKMNEIKEVLNDKEVGFLICSNEKIHVEEFSGLKIFHGNDHIIEDMYSLAKCDYIMGPPSTYSMWASYYGNVPLYQIKEITQAIKMNEFEIITN